MLQNEDNSLLGSYAQAGFRVGAGKSIFIFLSVWVMSWLVGSLVVMSIGGSYAIRWATVVQNVVMFITPALLSMYFVSWRPLSAMHLNSLPSCILSVLTALAVVVSIPFLNRVVAFNESISLPESMSGLEATLRNLEALAEQMIQSMLGESTVVSLVVCILIIGVLTGIAEEIFFRGAMQPLLHRVFGNAHVAVWMTAFVFSVMHFEFFGFIPRLLMGVFLGYLVCWSGSLWLSILAHALNNSLVVIVMWTERFTGDTVGFAKLGEGTSLSDWTYFVVSAALLVVLISRIRVRRDVR